MQVELAGVYRPPPRPVLCVTTILADADPWVFMLDEGALCREYSRRTGDVVLRSFPFNPACQGKGAGTVARQPALLDALRRHYCPVVGGGYRGLNCRHSPARRL